MSEQGLDVSYRLPSSYYERLPETTGTAGPTALYPTHHLMPPPASHPITTTPVRSSGNIALSLALLFDADLCDIMWYS